MGFWRGVGYFISILMIISGFLGALYTYGLSLVGAILGFIFIWMLKRSALQERMEKYLKQMRDSTETDEQRIKRKYEEDSSHCANCGKWMPWWNTKPLCKECGNKEMESSNTKLSDAEMDLANDEKKLAELESEKQNGEEEKRTFSEKQEKELKDEEELIEEQGIKDEIKRLEDKKKQLEKEKGD